MTVVGVVVVAAVVCTLSLRWPAYSLSNTVGSCGVCSPALIGRHCARRLIIALYYFQDRYHPVVCMWLSQQPTNENECERPDAATLCDSTDAASVTGWCALELVRVVGSTVSLLKPHQRWPILPPAAGQAQKLDVEIDFDVGIDSRCNIGSENRALRMQLSRAPALRASWLRQHAAFTAPGEVRSW